MVTIERSLAQRVVIKVFICYLSLDWVNLLRQGLSKQSCSGWNYFWTYQPKRKYLYDDPDFTTAYDQWMYWQEVGIHQHQAKISRVNDKKSCGQCVNSLATGRCGSDFEILISQLLLNSSLGTCEVAFRWMPQNFTNEKSIIIDSGNGLVPSGNKPLPEPILI